MAFKVKDYMDLIRLLQEHPEWRTELRHLLLTDDLLTLPEMVRDLVEAQRRTEEQLAKLAEAQRRTEERLEALVEAQRRTEERVSRVEEELTELAEAQCRTEERLEALAEAQRRTEERLEALVEAQRRTEERVSRVEEELAKLAEAQRRTEERLEALAEAQRRTEERLEALAEAQRRTEERVNRVEEELAKLAEAQRRAEERVSRMEEELMKLAEAQRHTEEQMRALAEAQARFLERQEWLITTVGDLKGRVLERTYQDKASAYFGPLLQRLRVVDPYTLEETLRAHLSAEEFYDVLRVDLLVCGQPRLQPEVSELWLAVEISAVVDQGDVERARRRAAHLRRAGYRAIPMVAGERLTQGAEDETREQRVAVMQDGSVSFWEEALHAWAGST